jgi:hypothetical protein
MIYVQRSNGGELFECRTSEEAVQLIAEERLLPNALKIWSVGSPLKEISFAPMWGRKPPNPLVASGRNPICGHQQLERGRQR